MTMKQPRSDKNNSAKNDDLKYQVYLDDRKTLINLKAEDSRLLDKSILTLSGGAFGISLAFLRQIAPDPESWSIGVLISSWVLFGISILTTLISLKTSQRACEKQIEILEGDSSQENDNQEERVVRNSASTLTNRLNYCSITSFIIGAVLLSIFSIVNLTK
jgi:hypothetical protein